jgi:hypothetical protein
MSRWDVRAGLKQVHYAAEPDGRRIDQLGRRLQVRYLVSRRSCS